jgi:hypothetical protein
LLQIVVHGLLKYCAWYKKVFIAFQENDTCLRNVHGIQEMFTHSKEWLLVWKWSRSSKILCMAWKNILIDKSCSKIQKQVFTSSKNIHEVW